MGHRMKKVKILLSDIDNLKSMDDTVKEKILGIFSGENWVDLAHFNDEEKNSLCIHFDSHDKSLSNIKAILATQGFQLNEKYQSLSLNVTNLDCVDCVKVIEHVLGRISGVISIYGSYTTGAFRVDYDASLLNPNELNRKLNDLGYNYNYITTTSDVVLDTVDKISIETPHTHKHEHKHTHDHKHDYTTEKHDHSAKKLGEVHIGCGGGHSHSAGFFGKYKELIFCGITGVLWLISFILSKTSLAPISILLLIIAYFTGGFEAFKDSIRAITQKRFSIESLMIFAAVGAGLIGRLNEGVLLLFLFSLGHALEHFALEKAKGSIKALTDLSPKKAYLKNTDGTTTEVLVETLVRGQIVVVKPGQIIPSDGMVKLGTSNIDQSAITGESIPVTKTEGEEVFAGTINSDGLLEIEITKLASETMLTKMIRLITEADTQKSGSQRFAEKFEKIFVPVVLIAIVLIAVVPPLLNLSSLKASIYMAIIILVSASPCALALATPVAVLVGISRAAKLGVLIKGGAALENLGQINAIAFDKTGTLTRGKPAITKIVALNGYNDVDVLGLAYGLELGSAHPLAHAIIEYCKVANIVATSVTDMKNVPGVGISGVFKEQILKFGSPRMFDKLPEDILSTVNNLEESGSTTMILSCGEKFIGIVGIADQVRDGIKNILSKLKQLGVQKNIMLTGDNLRVAKVIGEQVAIDEIKAELLPEDKVTQIRSLNEQYKNVAMVGDGVNDAPAMANASVGIAMGGTKTDVAIETSDVVLMNDNLSRLPQAISLSKDVKKIIKQNLFISLGVIGVLVVTGLLSITNIVTAVGIHEGTTLIVIFNALRLLYLNKNKD